MIFLRNYLVQIQSFSDEKIEDLEGKKDKRAKQNNDIVRDRAGTKHKISRFWI